MWKLVTVILALLASPAGAQGPPYPLGASNPNIRGMAWSFVASSVLARCHRGSARAVAGDELEDYDFIADRILDDARKRDPSQDFLRLAYDASIVPHTFNTTADPAPHICDWARVSLSLSYWQRTGAKRHNNDGSATPLSEALRLQLAGCSGGPCLSDRRDALDREGLLAVPGPYCRANRAQCDQLRAARDANIPIKSCEWATDLKKCEAEIAEQQERFRKGSR